MSHKTSTAMTNYEPQTFPEMEDFNVSPHIDEFVQNISSFQIPQEQSTTTSRSSLPEQAQTNELPTASVFRGETKTPGSSSRHSLTKQVLRSVQAGLDQTSKHVSIVDSLVSRTERVMGSTSVADIGFERSDAMEEEASDYDEDLQRAIAMSLESSTHHNRVCHKDFNEDTMDCKQQESYDQWVHNVPPRLRKWLPKPLNLRAGDTVEVVDEEDAPNGMMHGRLMGGASGWFPVGCCVRAGVVIGGGEQRGRGLERQPGGGGFSNGGGDNFERGYEEWRGAVGGGGGVAVVGESRLRGGSEGIGVGLFEVITSGLVGVALKVGAYPIAGFLVVLKLMVDRKASQEKERFESDEEN